MPIVPKLRKPLLTHLISHSNFSIHRTNLFFLHFSCVFICLKIIKHDMLHMLLIFSIFNIKMAAQKFTNLGFLRFYLFFERGERREKERERNITVWLPLARPLLGTWHTTQACVPDWESNWRPFSSQASAQSTEPHQPGLV